MRNNENYRNEIKVYIVRAGMTMNEVADVLGYNIVWQKRRK